MVNYCVCAGCTNTCQTGQRVFRFPSKTNGLFRQWVRFVQVRRADFTASSVTKNSVVCDAHFEESSYIKGDFLEWKMGFRKKSRVRLTYDAVPSIQLRPTPELRGPAEQSSRESLQRKRVVREMMEMAVVVNNEPEQPEQPEQPELAEPACAPMQHRGLQCDIKCATSSTAIQAKPHMVSVSTQTDLCMLDTPLALESEDEEDEDDSASLMDQHDLSWIPDEDMATESSDEEQPEEPMLQPLSASTTDKYIVCQSQFLFSVCPACREVTQGQIMYQEGTYIKIKQSCSCGYERNWQNQDILHRNMPACNLLLSGAIQFSGCMATQTLRMLKLFGLQCISANTYFRHQRLYTVPTIVQAWQEEQREIVSQLKEMGDGLILSGDCRSDSPGHCAKYGTYTVIEDRVNKVLDLQLVQSSEVPSSSWCEMEGLKRCVRFVKEQHGMRISALITDRNRQVSKWVREQLLPEGTSHFYDIWHIGKSVQKAVGAVAKERGCEDLALWTPAIVNHLYWTAASTPDGNPDVMVAKWESMVNHIQDIHEHNNPSFPKCAHPPLEGEARDKEWLEPGSTAAIKLETVASRRALLKDIRQLSPKHQTYSLEAFHSLILHFAPKHTAFSFVGMYSRLLLAALHFNANSNREAAITEQGERRYAVGYPRFRKGSWTVRPLKEKPSYEYASDLMKALQDGYRRSPQALREHSRVLCAEAPAPLSIQHKVAKDEAVNEYLTRHSRFNS